MSFYYSGHAAYGSGVNLIKNKTDVGGTNSVHEMKILHLNSFSLYINMPVSRYELFYIEFTFSCIYDDT
jgi:hypothetical protein